MAHPDVFFCRDIKPGARGKDVIAHKRAVSRAYPEFYPWHDFSDFYGEFFERAVIKVKKANNLGSDDGVIRVTLHELLERKRAKRKPTEWAFDEWAELQAQQFCNAFTQYHVREEICDAGFYWYSKRSRIHYSMGRPIPYCNPPQVPDAMDCSGLVSNCHYAAGVPDPNRLGYNGQGYTGTLLAGGTRCKLSELKPGDAVFYGFSSGRPGFPKGAPTHVALYVGDGMVLSLGHYPMIYADFKYRSDINCYVTYNID